MFFFSNKFHLALTVFIGYIYNSRYMMLQICTLQDMLWLLFMPDCFSYTAYTYSGDSLYILLRNDNEWTHAHSFFVFSSILFLFLKSK